MLVHGRSWPGTALLFFTIVSLESAVSGQMTTQSAPASRLPSVQEVAAANTDVWGEAALRQPDGASYEFFKDLFPPLRYVDAAFRHYPLMLSAPQGLQKTRLVSNGSVINARANKKPMWYEFGTPVAFSVGDPPEAFGGDLTRLDGPRYLEGHLPVVQMAFRCGGVLYHEEVFAPVEPEMADRGAVMVRFTVSEAPFGHVEAHVESETALQVTGQTVLDAKRQAILTFSAAWQWQAERRSLTASIKAGDSADLLILTNAGPPVAAITAGEYGKRRESCAKRWTELLARGTGLQVPEPIVEDAWRSMIIGDFMVAAGDRMHYSAGNAYAKLYQAECGDALRSLVLFGQTDAAREMLKPVLEFYREATRAHVAGHKLQLLTWYYWVTHDTESIWTNESLWRKSLDYILNNRESETGLLPKDNYAGDISQKVYSLNSNASCWRGLRDAAAMLDDMGRKDEAGRILEQAAAYRRAILDAVTRSERLDTKPPFIPVALLADEPAHDPLTATQMGSYYDLIVPYIIGSEIFGQGSQREDWLLGYLENHGGIAMGMIRTTPHQGQFDNQPGVNVLYGLRYQLALLRRDEREKALVGFYGQLAQGMSRDTFIGGEGSRFLHGDQYGRSMYLPPNTASNAMFLLTLRYLLIQDWDLNEDGRPDTLRLLYGVPRRWLKDGAEISFKDAPSMFGKLSLEVQSHLGDGHIDIRITAPPRQPTKTLLRLPLPGGWKAADATVDGMTLPVASDGAVDLSGRGGAYLVRFIVMPVSH
jgi:hypothetical protein